MLDFYLKQSPFTDPGEYAPWYDALPDDLNELAKVVQGLIYHYQADQWIFKYQYPKFRITEIDTRSVSRMLERLTVMDTHPLSIPRECSKRMVGCCRDFALLYTSMLRHKGIPARPRHGFAAYLKPRYFMDHVVTEYWDGERWRLVDAEMSPAHIRHFHIGFDVMDVPRHQFIVAGEAWWQVKNWISPAECFGLGPRSRQKGKSFILTRLQQDIAALNGMELLPWDEWALPDDPALIQRAAELSHHPEEIDALQQFYNETAFKVPEVIESYSPAYPSKMLPRMVRLWNS